MLPRQLVPLKEVPQHRPHKTERQLRRLRSENRVPFHKIDGRIYFDLADLDSYDEGGRVEVP